MAIMTDRDNDELMVLTSNEFKELYLKNGKKNAACKACKRKIW